MERKQFFLSSYKKYKFAMWWGKVQETIQKGVGPQKLNDSQAGRKKKWIKEELQPSLIFILSFKPLGFLSGFQAVRSFLIPSFSWAINYSLTWGQTLLCAERESLERYLFSKSSYSTFWLEVGLRGGTKNWQLSQECFKRKIFKIFCLFCLENITKLKKKN